VTFPDRLRFARRVIALAGLVLLCVPAHLLAKALTGRSAWPPRFLGLAARACGARVRVTGTPLAADVFFLANHQSWLDILILGGAIRSAFVSKAELARAPLVGWLADMNRTIYVDRADRRGMPEQIAALRTAIAGGAVTIFPEGTTGDGITLLPFKAPLLQVLDPPPPGLRVQPVFVDYGAAAPDIAWSDEDGRANVIRVLSRRGRLPVVVHCLEPFDPAAYPGRKAIAAEARRRIAEAIAASGSRMRA
jgi:lyso-ornithine lipid O-acyltransferase